MTHTASGPPVAAHKLQNDGLGKLSKSSTTTVFLNELPFDIPHASLGIYFTSVRKRAPTKPISKKLFNSIMEAQKKEDLFSIYFIDSEILFL